MISTTKSTVVSRDTTIPVGVSLTDLRLSQENQTCQTSHLLPKQIKIAVGTGQETCELEHCEKYNTDSVYLHDAPIMAGHDVVPKKNPAHALRSQ